MKYRLEQFARRYGPKAVSVFKKSLLPILVYQLLLLIIAPSLINRLLFLGFALFFVMIKFNQKED